MPSERLYSKLLTAELAQIAERSDVAVEVLADLFNELSFRSRKQARELREAVAQEINRRNTMFAWPETEIVDRQGVADEIPFIHATGILGFMGYRVGQSGHTDRRRRELLDDVFTLTLPRINSEAYMAEWGAPSSAGRLKKIAYSLATFAKNAKRQGRPSMVESIKDWEADLAYLKQAYYDSRRKFDWPSSS
jgi:hypothetical protein